jgi:hypothetical protein
MPEEFIGGSGVIVPLPLGGNQEGGKAMTVKQIKRALKKQHKKTTGKRATLLKRLRSKRGGADDDCEVDGKAGKIDPETKECVVPTEDNEEPKVTGSGADNMAGGRHTAKHLKQLLKKHGLKTTGTKRALTRRAKKARLL